MFTLFTYTCTGGFNAVRDRTNTIKVDEQVLVQGKEKQLPVKYQRIHCSALWNKKQNIQVEGQEAIRQIRRFRIERFLRQPLHFQP